MTHCAALRLYCLPDSCCTTDPLEDHEGAEEEAALDRTPSVTLRLDVTMVPPVLRHMEFSRQGASGGAPLAALSALACMF